MFKEQYVRDNDRLEAKEALFMEIQDKLTQEQQTKVKRNRFVRWTAIAATMLLVFGGTLGLVLPKAKKADINKEQQSLSADSVLDYATLYDMVETLGGSNGWHGRGLGGFMNDGMVLVEDEVPMAEMAAPAAAPAEDSSGSSTAYFQNETGHSETNVQVAGVDEADILKTDGKYIYYLVQNTLYIAFADGINTRVLSSTLLDSREDGYWHSSMEMYLLGDRLMIISQGWSVMWIARGLNSYESGYNNTRITIYDVSNRSRPVEELSLGQSGSYVSSRMIGDMVYLITSHYIYDALKDQPKTFVPLISAGNTETLLPASDVLVYGTPAESAYTVIGAINLKSGTAHESAKAVFGSTGNIYCSGEHLLVAQSEYTYNVSDIAPDKKGENVQITESASNTKLILFQLDHGKITKLAQGTVPGSLLNQFSMDEYKGVFRVVTSVNRWVQRIYTDGLDRYEYDSEDYNCLYTLNQDLEILGKIEKLAKDEWVKSVRFDGDIGYFVTFRQVDPLFAVDLSDPKKPRVLSALKIPGFSEYLHVYGEEWLLGLGYQADEKTGRREGVKLSMFDISNKADVRELSTANLDAAYTVVGYNHKAILVHAERNIIAFPADNAYYIYTYHADTGFSLLKKVGVSDDIWSSNLRGLFIGSNFYVLSESGMTVIDMISWERISKLNW